MKVNQLGGGAILSLGAILIGSGIQIIYTPIFLKHLGSANYGINSFVQALIGYITMMSLGFETTMLRYIVQYRNSSQKDKIPYLNGIFFLIFITLGLTSCIVGIIIYFYLENFLNGSFTVSQVIITKKVFLLLLCKLGFSFPIMLFSTYIISKEKFIFAKSIALINVVLNPLLGIILVSNGFGLIEITLGSLGCTFIFGILNIYYAYKLGIIIKFGHFEKSLLKELFIFTSFIFMNALIDRLYWSTDKIILSKFSGPISVGIYSIASLFVTVYTNVSTGISGVLSPKINKLVAENQDDELSVVFIRVGRIQFLLLSLILTGFIVLGMDFIYLWVGENVREIYIIALITMIPLIIPLCQNTGIIILQAKNLHRFRSIVYLIIAFLNVLLSLILVGHYGAIGCAIGTGIAYVVGPGLIINIYYAKKVKLQIVDFWKQIIKMLIPILVLLVVGIVLNNVSSFKITWINFIKKGIIFTIVYGLITYFFSLNTYEKSIIKRILKRLINK